MRNVSPDDQHGEGFWRASVMSSIAPSPENQATVPREDARFVGVATRSVSWVLDAIAINVIAIMTGLGAELILSIFPVSPNFAAVLKPIAGAVYIAWAALYFVTLWSWTGQTLGARVMQIRLLTATGGRVKPARALVRWVGMNLAMLPLFAGFAPILFRRRGFPDWLARTKVIHWEQVSIAQSMRTAPAKPRGEPVALPPSISPERDS
jgi:uncharacterized RDD family membrane protein YckC